MKKILMTLLVVLTNYNLASASDSYCYSSGKNYYCPKDDGMVWCYPSGSNYYCPRPNASTVWCYPTGKTYYCPTSEGNWWFAN